MKQLYKHMWKYLMIMILLTGMVSCETELEEEVHNEIAETNFFLNDQDAVTAVNAVYSEMRNDGWGMFSGGTWSIWSWNEAQTDEVYVNWGGEHWGALEDFVIRSNDWQELELCFSDLYEGIAMANNVLEKIETDAISEEIQERVRGEATFGRALFYYHAFSLWNEIPLVKEFNPDPKFYPEQVSPDEMAAFIIEELQTAEQLLPESYSSNNYGRFTKGAAQALLARFYLNQKMWQEAADKSKDIIDSDNYEIADDYSAVFSPENAGNPEIILALPCIAQIGVGNTFLTHTTPGDFEGNAGWNGYRVRNDFYATFDDEDIRADYLTAEYTTSSGETNEVTDGVLILKYGLDENAAGEWAGNDIVLHRYAEVLLTRAEALNELDGPNQESINLINELRERAFPDDPSKLLEVGDFATKEELRDHILMERGWELYAEGYRREDLIRHGEFISQAIEREKDAQPHHVHFPIPQIELDQNPNLEQIDGYD